MYVFPPIVELPQLSPSCCFVEIMRLNGSTAFSLLLSVHCCTNASFCGQHSGLTCRFDWISAALFPSGYSPEDSSPQRCLRIGSGGCNACSCSGGPTGNGTGAAGAFQWNPIGDSLLQGSYDFAFLHLTPTLSNDVVARGLFNEKRVADDAFAAHEIEFNFPMLGVDNTKQCLADGQCIPVGGYSVWSSPFEAITNDSASGRHWILATAHFDSTALFHDLAVGANDGISGTVALLAAATTLAEHSAVFAALPKRVVLALFNAENFGFAGSRKFIADLTNFTCNTVSSSGTGCSSPYKPDLQFRNLSLPLLDGVIELNQVAQHSGTVYLHRQKDGNALTDAIINTLSSIPGDGLLVANASASTPGVPPSSLQSFLKTNANTPGVVITDYAATYSNLYVIACDSRRISSDVCAVHATSILSVHVRLGFRNLMHLLRFVLVSFQILPFPLGRRSASHDSMAHSRHIGGHTTG